MAASLVPIVEKLLFSACAMDAVNSMWITGTITTITAKQKVRQGFRPLRGLQVSLHYVYICNMQHNTVRTMLVNCQNNCKRTV